MNDLLSNRAGLVALCCLTALVIGVFSTLLGLLRGDRRIHTEAAKWGQAFTGGQSGRARDAAQLEALRRAVSGLEPAPPGAETRPDERDGE